jgi:hypothetical protein
MRNGLGTEHQQCSLSRLPLGHESDDKAYEGHEQASAGQPECDVIGHDEIQFFASRCTQLFCRQLLANATVTASHA